MRKKLLSLALALALVLTSAITPAFAATTADLKQQRETEHFVFYCMDQDVKALDDLEKALEGCYNRVTTDLGKAPSGKTRVNIYPDIDSFHNAVGRPDARPSSVGEVKDGIFYLTSPLNPGTVHDYDAVIQIAVHEFTHVVIGLFGNVPSYLNEGVACYEARQYSYQELSESVTNQMNNGQFPGLPNIEKFTSSTPGMYEVSYVFIDFIARCYGFDAVVALLEGKPLATAIGKNGASMQNQSFNEFWFKTLDNLYRQRFGLGSGESLETDHFVFLFMEQDSEAVSKLAEKLEQDRTKITADLGAAPEVKTMIYLYPDAETFHETIYPYAGTAYGTTFGYNNIFSVIPENCGPEYTEGRVRADIKYYSNMAALFPLSDGKDVPSYILWGVAGYEAGVEFNDLKGYVKKAADSGKLPTLADLEEMDNGTGRLQYGYLYVEFVAQTLGYKNLNDNLASLVKGESPETVFGMTSQQLEEKWQAFLKDYDRMALAPNLDTASTWARAGIVSAVKDGLVPADLQDNYKDMITRSQFAALSVALYEAMSGETAPAPGENPFSDTDDPVVLQANALGIVKGSGGKFAPDDLVTRQEMALMLSRVYTKLGGAIPQAASTTFADDGDISPWTGLKEAIAFMSDKGILKGTDGKYNPKSNASIQEAIAVALRMFENLDV